MAKLLTNREMELFLIALNLEVALDKCNPDVGFPPTRRTLAEKLVKKLSFKIDDDDIEEICGQ